jgi:hypothetical protein
MFLLSSIKITFLISTLLIAVSINAPDVDAYISEIQKFDYSFLRVDYISWFFLWLMGVDNIFQFHALSICIFGSIVIKCKQDGNEDYIALAALMPMVLGSQVRLLLASVVFLFVLKYFRNIKGFFLSILISGMFHFSFVFIFLFPIYFFWPDFFGLILPFGVSDFFFEKINAYTLGDDAPSVYSKILLASILLVNFVLLVKQKDFRAFIICLYLFLLPIIPGELWIIYRRLIELVLFIAYPFFFKNYKNLDIYSFFYFSLLSLYLILNTLGYVQKVSFT